MKTKIEIPFGKLQTFDFKTKLKSKIETSGGWIVEMSWKHYADCCVGTLSSESTRNCPGVVVTVVGHYSNLVAPPRWPESLDPGY